MKDLTRVIGLTDQTNVDSRDLALLVNDERRRQRSDSSVKPRDLVGRKEGVRNGCGHKLGNGSPVAGHRDR